MDHKYPQPNLQRKAFYELVQTDAWKIGLKPLLDYQVSKRDLDEIQSLDDAFKQAKALTQANQARYIIALVERMAREHLQISQNQSSPE